MKLLPFALLSFSQFGHKLLPRFYTSGEESPTRFMRCAICQHQAAPSHPTPRFPMTLANQDPFSSQDFHEAEIQSSRPYLTFLLPRIYYRMQNSRIPSLYGSVFINRWGWDLTAWLLAAVSTVTLLTVIAVFANKSLRSWDSTITPAAVVAILSQFGQTAILASVTACIYQSM